MKTRSFFLFSCMVLAISAHSQFYTRISFGGGLGFPVYGKTWDTRANSYNNFTTTVNNISYGNGIAGSISVGYFFNKYIGLDFSIREFYCFKFHTWQYIDSTMQTQSKQINSGQILQVIPSIVLTPGFTKINPYLRVGIIVGVLPTLTSEYYQETTDGELINKYKYHGGIAIGFCGSGGVDFKLSKLIKLFAELEGNLISYSPNKRSMTKLTEYGKDIDLSTIKVKYKETIYVKSLNSEDNKSLDQPGKDLRMSYSFNNFMLNLGIKFTF